MTPEQELVHNHLQRKHYGGLYLFEECEPDRAKQALFRDVLGSIDFWQQEHRNGGLLRNDKPFPHVKGAIAWCTRINACAFKISDTLYITMCRGLYDIIRHACNRILCEPHVFSWLGDVSKEQAGRAKSFVHTDSMLLHANDDIVPNNDLRRIAASYMAHTAREFLIMHEFRHLIAGHVEYYMEALNCNLINEGDFEPADSSSRSNLIRQALEIEADCDAAFRRFELVLGPINNPSSGILTRPEYEFLTASPLGASVTGFVLTLAAILVAIKLFRYQVLDFGLWDTRTHPPDEVRRLAILRNAQAYLPRWNLKNESLYPERIGEILSAIDETLHGMLQMAPLTREWLAQASPGGDFEKHYNRLMDIFLDTYYAIQPYSYVERLPEGFPSQRYSS